MKKMDKEQNQKRNTTNYPKDSHKEFCKRCMKFNNGCPAKDPEKCNL